MEPNETAEHADDAPLAYTPPAIADRAVIDARLSISFAHC
jgi:hypothetical protein